MLSSLAEFLEREAGHIVISLGLIALGLSITGCGAGEGKEIVVFSLGVLSRSMLGTPGAKKGGQG